MEGLESKTVLNKVGHSYVVSIPNSLSSRVLEQLKKDLSESLQSDFAQNIIFDFSAVQILDYSEFNQLVNQAKTVVLLGASPYFVSLNPCIVAILAKTDIDLQFVTTCLSVQDALIHIQQKNESGNGVCF